MKERPNPHDIRSGKTPQSRRRAEPSALVKQVGLLSAIPFVLLLGPLIGYYLGLAADQRWDSSPWGMVIGIILGLLASARVTIQYINQARKLTRHE